MKKLLLSLVWPFAIAILAAGSMTACSSAPPSFQTSTCGNKVKDLGETCDTGIENIEDGGCYTQETCEDEGGIFSGSACQSTCTILCGNGKLDEGESCDRTAKNPAEKCKTKIVCESQPPTAPNHRYVYSGRVSDCTAKCTDKEVSPYWGPCNEDIDCSLDAPLCRPFLGKDNTSFFGKPSSFKKCTKPCELADPNSCKGLALKGIDASCAVDWQYKIDTGGQNVFAALCYPGCPGGQSQCEEDYTCVSEPDFVGFGAPACLYDPMVKNKQVGQTCDPSDASTCSQGDCRANFFGSNPTDGLCTSACGLSTDGQDLKCPDGNNCEKFGPNDYICLRACDATTPCPGNAFCAIPHNGKGAGSCYPLPFECGTDKECKDRGLGTKCVAGKVPGHPTLKMCTAGEGTGSKGIGKIATDVSECAGGKNAILLGNNACSIDCSAYGEDCPADTVCAVQGSTDAVCLQKCDYTNPNCPEQFKCLHILTADGQSACVPQEKK